jgi:peptidoglycan-associated lipoprotein
MRKLMTPMTALMQILFAAAVVQSSACATPTAKTAAPVIALVDDDNQRGEFDALEAQGPLFFETDSEELTHDSRELLKRVAQQLFKQPRAKLVVTGHADERGDTSYNLALGERRGHAARQFLVRMGVPAGRVKVISLGEEQPIADGHSDDSWAMNRRDEFGFIVPQAQSAMNDEDSINLGLETRLIND